jgi:hypothetical protein
VIKGSKVAYLYKYFQSFPVWVVLHQMQIKNTEKFFRVWNMKWARMTRFKVERYNCDPHVNWGFFLRVFIFKMFIGLVFLIQSNNQFPDF